MQRFKDILCVVASHTVSGAAMEHAVALANNNQARLTVVEVIDELPPNLQLVDRTLFPKDFQAKRAAEHRQGLEELVAPWNGDIETQTKVFVGTPFLEIIHEVLRNGRDLVVKTAESGGLLDRVFGSDDMHLLRKCPCPVWLVKSQSPKTYHRILAAVDVDEHYPPKELNTRHQLNLQILEMASSLSLSGFSELHIVHAWEAIAEGSMRSGFMQIPDKKVDAYVEEVRQQHEHNLNVLIDEMISKLGRNASEYLNPQAHLLKGSPRKEIPAFADKIDADLVIMGTVSRTGISGFFMGNTAESILNQLDCSILAVKPPGFVTPVTLED